MVTRKRQALTCLILVVFCASLTLALVPSAKAQVTYSVSQEWLKVWVTTDGSTDFLYNITFTYLSGSPQGYFDLGMPKAGYQIHYVQDLANNSLQYSDISSGGYIGIEVAMKQPIHLNQPYSFLVYATVSGLVSPDGTNPGNVGMQFYPGTFQDATGTENLRVEFELPPGVPQNSTRSPQGLDFDNVFADENRTAVYWERASWSPGTPFLAGVSFPQQYVTVTPAPSYSFTNGPYPSFTQGSGFPNTDFITAGAVVFVVIVIIVIFVFFGVAKAAYVSPRLSVEALGANRSLTAVEAGLVLGLKPVRVLTMMLYGLLLKRQVAVVESEPLLKLRKLAPPPRSEPAPENAAAAPAPPVRYYEIDFLNAIKPDGTLDETALADAYRGLVNTVNQKLKGYSREDTENYYQSIVDKAWGQVTKAGTADLMGNELDKNLEWLLADNKFDDNLRTAFPPGIVIVPNPLWWWYWGGPHYPHGPQPTGTPVPSSGPPTVSVPAPSPRLSPTTPAPVRPAPVAGQDFANNIVHGLQGASNNIVLNVQDFANKLVPFAAPAVRGQGSGSDGNHPSCVCACHACACHCACVSCACACAGGGAH
jgi:hypothetical protein